MSTRPLGFLTFQANFQLTMIEPTKCLNRLVAADEEVRVTAIHSRPYIWWNAGCQPPCGAAKGSERFRKRPGAGDSIVGQATDSRWRLQTLALPPIPQAPELSLSDRKTVIYVLEARRKTGSRFLPAVDEIHTWECSCQGSSSISWSMSS